MSNTIVIGINIVYGNQNMIYRILSISHNLHLRQNPCGIHRNFIGKALWWCGSEFNDVMFYHYTKYDHNQEYKYSVWRSIDDYKVAT